MERYISQKFDFPATGRTLEELKAELLQRNADERIVTDLAKFIELLDSYRFGQASFDEKSRSALLDQAHHVRRRSGERDEAGRKREYVGNRCRDNRRPCRRGVVGIGGAGQFLVRAGQQVLYRAAVDSAVVYYEKIVSSGATSPEVYFNLGNAYFRLKKIGMSRLCFEKAAVLDPSDADIAANIKFVSSNIADLVTEPQRGFLEAVLHHIHVMMPLQTQLWFCGALLLVIGILASMAFFASGFARLWLIYASVLCGLVLCVFGTSMIVKIYDAETTSWAILLDPSADARNEPDGPRILFTAHEGTKFQIRKTVEGWSLVSLPNGAAGWIENKALGRI